jgi:hypothetical protein
MERSWLCFVLLKNSVTYVCLLLGSVLCWERWIMPGWGDGQSDNRHRPRYMRSGFQDRVRIIMPNERRGKDNVAFNSRTRENIRPSESWVGKGGEPRVPLLGRETGACGLGKETCVRQGIQRAKGRITGGPTFELPPLPSGDAAAFI